ncbi:MAG TPA: biotin/lipoyl-binding protein, partial [Gammaproteobacteria bacterium]|nr:biotin/lipoyl-binding protein [Gammaproteobacteria bacterium]
MKNRNRSTLVSVRLPAIAVLVGALALGACSSGKDQQQVSTPHDVTLTAAQQQNIHLYTVEAAEYHTTVDTTGIVDFDRNRSTPVLAPFSGPVAKLLVTQGETVKKGQALATVDS